MQLFMLEIYFLSLKYYLEFLSDFILSATFVLNVDPGGHRVGINLCYFLMQQSREKLLS